MFLQLGDYIFEGIKLPQSWAGSFATNYAQIPIIDGKPVVQKTGEKLIEFDITAEFRDEFCTPADEVEALQLYRINGNVLQLTGGDGVNYGRYVITDISIVNVRASNDGYVSAIQASIKLLEYNTTATTVKQTGAALKSSAPVEETPLSPLVPLPAQISNNISSGIVKSNEINTRSNSSTLNYSRISSLAAEAVNAFDAANTQVESTEKVIYRAIALQNSLTSAKNAAQAVKTASDIQNFTDLMTANDNLSISVYHLKGAAAPVAAFVGSREGGK